jgi:hypothetical protein
MIKLGSSNVLGIAVSDQSITCAELVVRADRKSIRKTAVFTFPAELTLDKPDAVGQALAVFLRSNGFSASRAVVGVPAKWVIASERDVPPASTEQVRGMLRLAAERLAATESGELVFDYAGEQQAKTGKVLLVAMLKKKFQQIEQAIEAAGLKIIAITPTALALAGAAEAADRSLPMLTVAQHGAEFVLQNDGSPKLLRHVSLAATNGHGPTMGSLGAELKRTVAMGSSANEIVLWDAIGLSESQVGELSDRSGLKVRLGNVANAPEKFAQPVALAMAGADRSLLPLDFSHSRLAPREKRRFGRSSYWAAGIGGLLLIGILVLFFDARHEQSVLDDLIAKNKGNAAAVKAANNVIDRVMFSRGYFTQRSDALESLREVTMSFRDDEQIWATSYSLKDNGKGQLAGKAMDEATILALADRMGKNPKFKDVHVLDVSESGGRSRDRSFSISFTFNQ